MFLTSKNSAALFLIHIFNIVDLRPEEKMIGIDAITNFAFVKYEEAIRNFSSIYFPRCTMGLYHLTILISNCSVASWVEIAEPQPATIDRFCGLTLNASAHANCGSFFAHQNGISSSIPGSAAAGAGFGFGPPLPLVT